MKTNTKRILAVLMAVLMVFALAACGKTEEAAESDAVTEEPEVGETTGLANPFKSYASVDELNETFGTKFTTPGVMGVSDESFTAIDQATAGNVWFAQYKFTLAGHEFVYRASLSDEDFSGIYVGESTLCETAVVATGIVKSSVVNVYASDDTKAARWSTPEFNYILSCNDENAYTAEEYLGLVEEFVLRSAELDEGDMEGLYDSLAGEYADLYSQRAVMDVLSEGNRLNIVVSWGSSAMETTQWIMTAVLEPGETWDQGQLAYSDCTKVNLLFDESGKETDTVEYENGNGYFVLNEDRTISWEGSPEESCMDCIFQIY